MEPFERTLYSRSHSCQPHNEVYPVLNEEVELNLHDFCFWRVCVYNLLNDCVERPVIAAPRLLHVDNNLSAEMFQITVAFI